MVIREDFSIQGSPISKLISEIREVRPEYVKCPMATEEWNDISKKFTDRRNFHHCMGALDGKLIAMRCPKNAGSLYYNYKGFFSIKLMALVYADYKCSWVEVGNHGSAGDAQVFNNGEPKEDIEKNSLQHKTPFRTMTSRCNTSSSLTMPSLYGPG